MAITNKTLSTDIEDIFISVGENAVTTMYFCNTSNTTVDFSVYAVPAAQQPANVQIGIDSVTIYKDIQLQSKDTYVIDSERFILGDGDGLFANTSSNSSVVVTVSSIGI